MLGSPSLLLLFGADLWRRPEMLSLHHQNRERCHYIMNVALRQVEKEMAADPEAPKPNAIFDESGKFIIYPCLLGIKVHFVSSVPERFHVIGLVLRKMGRSTRRSP